MKPEMILQSDVLDIIFENRNKDYGAYPLRRDYSQRLFYSLSGVLFVVLAGFIFLYWNNSRQPDTTFIPPLTNDTLKPIVYDQEIPRPKPVVIPLAQPQARTVRDVTPRIVPDTEKADTIPTIDDRQHALLGNENTDGPPIKTENILPPIKYTGNNPHVDQVPVPEPPVLDIAEVQPEFPGGVTAWLRFLQKNLRHPEEPAENEAGRKIEVMVKFIVNEDGTLSGLEVLQSGGKDFDKEVLRVLSKSPKWVAGSNKGKKVKVYHKQPVVFMYEANE